MELEESQTIKPGQAENAQLTKEGFVPEIH